MKTGTESGSSIENTDTEFPVSVLMERRQKRRDRWSFVEWKVTGVAAGGRFGRRPQKQVVHQDADCQSVLWRDFVIELIKDGAESYWNNLMAAEPSLFVVCRTDEVTGELEPFLVTANYDEIIGYMEVDDQVFSVPIPAEIYQWLERYVVNNYVPPERRKRKRADWLQNDNDQTPSPKDRH